MSVAVLVGKLGLSLPVVTILAKRSEKITRGNGFGLLGNWFFRLYGCFLSSLTHKPALSYAHHTRKRVLITLERVVLYHSARYSEEGGSRQ